MKTIGDTHIAGSLTKRHSLLIPVFRKPSSGNLIASASDGALLFHFSGLLEFFSVEPYLIRGRKQFRFGVKLISDNGQDPVNCTRGRS